MSPSELAAHELFAEVTAYARSGDDQWLLAYALGNRAMLDRGIYLAPSPFEAMFLSTAHTTEDVDRTIDSVRSVLAEVFGS